MQLALFVSVALLLRLAAVWFGSIALLRACMMPSAVSRSQPNTRLVACMHMRLYMRIGCHSLPGVSVCLSHARCWVLAARRLQCSPHQFQASAATPSTQPTQPPDSKPCLSCYIKTIACRGAAHWLFGPHQTATTGDRQAQRWQSVSRINTLPLIPLGNPSFLLQFTFCFLGCLVFPANMQRCRALARLPSPRQPPLVTPKRSAASLFPGSTRCRSSSHSVSTQATYKLRSFLSQP